MLVVVPASVMAHINDPLDHDEVTHLAHLLRLQAATLQIVAEMFIEGEDGQAMVFEAEQVPYVNGVLAAVRNEFVARSPFKWIAEVEQFVDDQGGACVRLPPEHKDTMDAAVVYIRRTMQLDLAEKGVFKTGTLDRLPDPVDPLETSKGRVLH